MAKMTRTSLIVDQKYLGKEPIFNDKVLSWVQEARAYGWYNYFHDNDDAKSFFLEYCKLNNIKVSLSRINFNNTFGWIARMIVRGAIFSESTLKLFNEYVEQFKVKKVVEEQPIENNESTRSRLELWLPEIEQMVDLYKTPFNCYNYLVNNNIPQIYAKQIMEYYIPQVAEAQAAYNKEDEDLVEAYRCYTRAEHKQFIARLQSIVEDCEKYLGNVKKERKPRKKKTPKLESVLKHFNYLRHDEKLKISSEDPAKIIGASAAYVLNTKYNTLTMFIAKDDKGLQIHRSSITNYDEKKSGMKRCGRIVDGVITSINSTTKKGRTKILELIKNDFGKFTDRIGADSLILKVDK